jgi:hypothetical protein
MVSNTNRMLLSLLLAVACIAAGHTPKTAAADSLLVMKPDTFERLKFDFNSNRNTVRLIFVLSPT